MTLFRVARKNRARRKNAK